MPRGVHTMPSAWAFKSTLRGSALIQAVLEDIAAERKARSEAIMDRVLVHTPESWTYDPFRTTRTGSKGGR